MPRKRNVGILIATAIIGTLCLGVAAMMENRPSISLTGEFDSERSSRVIRVDGNRAFKLRFSAPITGIIACQEFQANGKMALEYGGGWSPNQTTEVEVTPGNRLYPRVGEEKYLVIRCVAADKKTIVSDSIKIVRQ